MNLHRPGRRGERRAFGLAVIIVIQAFCAIFFIGDVLVDLAEGGHLDQLHLALETLAAGALIAGVVVLMVELRAILRRMSEMDAGLRAARGRMAEVLEEFFDRWGLTAAEREVALLILKGFDNAAISGIRGTAVGTVRAQATAVYSKAGVQGRAQFLSLFMDELLAEELVPTPPEAVAASDPARGEAPSTLH